MNSSSAPAGRTRFRWTRITALICFVGRMVRGICRDNAQLRSDGVVGVRNPDSQLHS